MASESIDPTEGSRTRGAPGGANPPDLITSKAPRTRGAQGGAKPPPLLTNKGSNSVISATPNVQAEEKSEKSLKKMRGAPASATDHVTTLSQVKELKEGLSPKGKPTPASPNKMRGKPSPEITLKSEIKTLQDLVDIYKKDNEGGQVIHKSEAISLLENEIENKKEQIKIIEERSKPNPSFELLETYTTRIEVLKAEKELAQAKLGGNKDVSELKKSLDIKTAKNIIAHKINEIIKSERTYIEGLSFSKVESKSDRALKDYPGLINENFENAQKFENKMNQAIKDANSQGRSMNLEDMHALYRSDEFGNYMKTIAEYALGYEKIVSLYKKGKTEAELVKFTDSLILPIQRGPRHEMLVKEILGSVQKMMKIDPNLGMEKIQNSLKEISDNIVEQNKESNKNKAIAETEEILEKLNAIVPTIKENEKLKLADGNLVRLKPSITSVITDRSTSEDSNTVVKSLLYDISTLAKNEDPSIRAKAKEHLESLEKNSWFMKTIQHDEALQSAYHQVNALTFKDVEALANILELVSKKSGTWSMGVAKNGTLIMKKSKEVKSEEAEKALKLASDILESSWGRIDKEKLTKESKDWYFLIGKRLDELSSRIKS